MVVSWYIIAVFEEKFRKTLFDRIDELMSYPNNVYLRFVTITDYVGVSNGQLIIYDTYQNSIFTFTDDDWDQKFITNRNFYRSNWPRILTLRDVHDKK